MFVALATIQIRDRHVETARPVAPDFPRGEAMNSLISVFTEFSHSTIPNGNYRVAVTTATTLTRAVIPGTRKYHSLIINRAQVAPK